MDENIKIAIAAIFLFLAIVLIFMGRELLALKKEVALMLMERSKIQSTDYSCGAVALQTVIHHFTGEYISELMLIDRLLSNPTIGTMPGEIVRVAHEFGLKAELRQNMTLDDIRENVNDGKPVIVVVKLEDVGHYIVINSIIENDVNFVESVNGMGKLNIDRFTNMWLDSWGVVVWR